MAGVLKALVLNVGGSEPDLEWTDWPDPVTQPDWVTVRVSAAGLNRNDSVTLDDPSLRLNFAEATYGRIFFPTKWSRMAE